MYNVLYVTCFSVFINNEILSRDASMRGQDIYLDLMIEKKIREVEIRNDKNIESELTLFVVVLHLYKRKDNRVMV